MKQEPPDYSYLDIVTASDAQNPKDRALFRFFEMLPGLMTWGTFFGIFLVSWLFPVAASLLFTGFVVYWFVRIIHFYIHLLAGYRAMRKEEKKDWLGMVQNLPVEQMGIQMSSWKDLYHLVIIPMYQESYEVMRGTFQALKDSDYPKDRVMVVLGIEERAREEARETASRIEQEFGSLFFKFMVTTHPSGLPGEIACKGSNEAWASKRAKEMIDGLQIPYDQIACSSFDADTAVFPKYFSCLAYKYLSSKDPVHTAFQPLPLFLNNVWQAPAISRLFSFNTTFWHAMNQERPEKLIVFSTSALSFQALVDVGFKAPNVVSDDSHIFWQCFLRYDGNFHVEPMKYPISMDANVGPNLLKTIQNIYRQQRRWAYGCGEIAYMLFGFSKNAKIPFRKKLMFASELVMGHWTWAISSVLLFVMGWLPLVLGGDAFGDSVLAYNLPRFTSWFMRIAMIGLVGLIILSMQFLPLGVTGLKRRSKIFFALQWLLLPSTLIFLTALPAIDAQTRLLFGKYMGFWATPKFRKKVTPSGASLAVPPRAF